MGMGEYLLETAKVVQSFRTRVHFELFSLKVARAMIVFGSILNG